MTEEFGDAGAAAGGAFELEQTLFQTNCVWFYQVPPGQVTTLSPRADSWDPDHPFLTGSLHIIQKGDACWIKLYEPLAKTDTASAADESTLDTQIKHTLFAQCPLEITKDLTLEVYVQDCVDSSRYFMIRVEDEQTKRRAYVGIGFPDRMNAFNFKATLQDYVKYSLRQLEAAAMAANSSNNESGSTDALPSLQKTQDYSLPEGTKIRINLKVNGERVERRRSSSGGGDGTAAGNSGVSGPMKIPLIPPPPGDQPSASAAVPANSPAKTVQTQEASVVADVADEDWGDFTSA